MRNILFRPGSNRLNAFLAVLLSAFASHPAPALAEIPQSEREALIAIYNSMGGPGWSNKTGWLDPAGSECHWYGVTCDAAQTTVLGLDLSDNNLNGAIPAGIANLVSLQLLHLSSPALTGSLPPELGALKQLRSLRLEASPGVGHVGLNGNIPAELGNLRNLETLVLSGNGLDSIPPALGNLSNLRDLVLSSNKLSGSIPATLGNLSSLVNLDLRGNQLTEIPAALGNLSSLASLDLSANRLGGSIPSALGNLSSLKALVLSNNQLSGRIPDTLGNLSSLVSLDLRANLLDGIPDTLGNLSSLEWLDASSNRLSGSIPAALGNLSGLVTLDLQENQLSAIPDALGNLSSLAYLDLSGNQLSGAIPSALGNLSSLVKLDLSRNQLSGSIPAAALGNLSSLAVLYLGGNQLSGSIPAALGNLSSLEALSLGGNKLSGSIPAALADLSRLSELFLSGNQLSGSIPPALGNLSSLVGLILASNQLSGSIPDTLGNLSRLSELNLSNNQLSGSIPDTLGNLSGLQRLYLSDNRLSGSIPPSLGNLSSLMYLYLNNNQLSGSIPDDFGNLSVIYAYLNNNRLSGSLPSSLAKLRVRGLNLAGNQLSGELTSSLYALFDRCYFFSPIHIEYNALYTSDPRIKSALDQCGFGWEGTQTVAPSGISANPSYSSSIVLSWQPIPFTGYGGSYEAWLCAADGKPSVLLGTTADKKSSSLALKGFNPGTTYSLAVRTISAPNPFNLNTVTSDFSPLISFHAPQNVSSLELTLNGAGAAIATTFGGTEATQAGYAEVAVESGSTPYVTALLRYRQNGVTVSEAGVPPSAPTRSARFFVDYRTDATLPGSNTKVEIYTGFAVVNRGEGPAEVSFILHDPGGQVISRGSRSLDKDAHLAAYFHQLPDIVPGFSIDPSFPGSLHFGTLELSSDQPLSVLALRLTTNQRGEMLMTSTPIADLARPSGVSPFGGLPLYLPQLADGAGYSTAIVLLNTYRVAETGELHLFKNDGSPLTVRHGNGSPASSFTYSIPPGGVYVLQTDASPQDIQTGWVELAPDPGAYTPAGAGILQFVHDGVLVTETGIPFVAPTAHARIFLDTAGGHNTGIAIANPRIAPLNISLQAFQMDGATPAGSVEGPIALDAKGHAASFVGQLISGLPSGFQGVLDIKGDTPFAAITYRSLVNEREEILLAAFPVADLSQPPLSPILFPQIADGDGFVTQFILLNASGPSSTRLSFFGETGTPLAVGKW